MDPYKLSGCGTALVTPFRNGEVDYPAYERSVKRQIDNGMHFLVALGSTAETPCLDDDEKKKLLQLTRELAPDKLVVAGVGTNSLKATIRNMRLLDDAHAYLVVVPYYNKPTQRGLYEYFKAVAEASDKPIILYNVPGRTGTNMTAATTLKLAQLPNVVAIKEASGNMEQIRAIIHGAPEGFAVLSGNDDQTLELMLEGGQGVISVASNVAPAQMVALCEAARHGDFKKASGIFRRLIPLFEACFIESNPIPVKAAMAMLGLMENELRLPLTSCEKSTWDKMQRVLSNLDLLKR
ncbi:MAG: 4-hydroxy-tetrahydrodipicolinate synthase [Bacteroidales bacterium]|nr:4-hydroxy-tetrahydrodipicolinate synthase [Bacteroidales bacterium]MCD8385457.1 4-hydroxy-tetrahydrodipicolinate synthase [Bacteroidales bacterium]